MRSSIAAIVTALVVPEILKQAIGSANPTILPLDYALNLGLFLAGLAVATAVAVLVTVWFRRPSRGGRRIVRRSPSTEAR